MDNIDLKPFYAYLDSRTDQRISNFFTQVDTVYWGVLLDKENRIARIKKTFSYLVEDAVKYMSKEVEITFDSYFKPSPLDFEITDDMQGLVLFLKEKEPGNNLEIELNYKCVFIPTGILTEAFLQGKNNPFGLRAELYNTLDSLDKIIKDITNAFTEISTGLKGLAVPLPNTDKAVMSLNILSSQLQNHIQNLEE